ncbi:MAG: wax ester/triacylglycerol synthase family O-acyltransferase [Steroidobacteraceae bacterium]
MPVAYRHKSEPMGLQDAVMLWADSAERPLHVGGYFICKSPARAEQDFARRLVATLRRHAVDVSPWNYRIARATQRESSLLPYWEVAPNADMRYHVVHHVLKRNGKHASLDALIAQLHSERLDMNRPLWQYHIIEGLPERRFAVYHKVHHALVDGFLGMQSFVRGTAGDSAASMRPVWSSGRTRTRKPARSRRSTHALPSIANILSDITTSGPPLLDALSRTLNAAAQQSSALIGPCRAPMSLFNAQITSRRCIAASSLDLRVVKTIARVNSVTVNDVLLAICGTALRRYLSEHRALPVAPLIALVPVALSRTDDEASGNRLGVMYASLGSDVRSASARLQAVARSMQAGKFHLQALPERLRGVYCTAALAPALINLWAPALGKPSGNVVISNMHGPQEPRYLNHSLVEGVYPLSAIVSGIALNITCVSYGDRLFMGLVACPDVTPDLPRLASFFGEAAEELHTLSRARRSKPRQPRQRVNALAQRPSSLG